MVAAEEVTGEVGSVKDEEDGSNSGEVCIGFGLCGGDVEGIDEDWEFCEKSYVVVGGGEVISCTQEGQWLDEIGVLWLLGGMDFSMMGCVIASV